MIFYLCELSLSSQVHLPHANMSWEIYFLHNEQKPIFSWFVVHVSYLSSQVQDIHFFFQIEELYVINWITMTRKSGKHCMQHTGTLNSCFNFIRSHQQYMPWFYQLKIRCMSTDVTHQVNWLHFYHDYLTCVQCRSVVEFRLCILWLLSSGRDHTMHC